MLKLDISKPVRGTAYLEIDKPITEVFSFVAEDFFENYPKWAPEVVDFKPINSNPMQEGALARQTRIEQGHKVESTFEIAELKKNERLVLKGLSDPFRHSYLFQPIDDNKTLLTDCFELLEIEIFMRPFEKLIRTALEEGLQNSINNIKNLLCEDASAQNA